jgi:hypothetical protein
VITKKNQQSFSILDGLKQLCLPAAVHELRIAKTSQGTILGFFTDRNKMAAWADRYSGLAPGIYFTLNPVLPDYLALANNRLKEYARTTTPDEGILQRRLLLIDADPVRQPKEISNLDTEHEAALACTFSKLASPRGIGRGR